jgi:hypothetical protein
MDYLELFRDNVSGKASELLYGCEMELLPSWFQVLFSLEDIFDIVLP